MSEKKVTEIIIDGCIDASENPTELDSFADKFVDWVESNNWFFGGGFREYIEEDEEKADRKIVFAVKGLLCNNDKFLALHKNVVEEDIWELPGGRSEFGETAEDTLIRELFEETGLTVKPIKLLDTWNNVNENKHLTGIIYLCKIVHGSFRISDEHDKYQWLDLNNRSINCLHDVFKDKMALWEWEEINRTLKIELD